MDSTRKRRKTELRCVPLLTFKFDGRLRATVTDSSRMTADIGLPKLLAPFSMLTSVRYRQRGADFDDCCTAPGHEQSVDDANWALQIGFRRSSEALD